jgi:hypothetical protein
MELGRCDFVPSWHKLHAASPCHLYMTDAGIELLRDFATACGEICGRGLNTAKGVGI